MPHEANFLTLYMITFRKSVVNCNTVRDSHFSLSMMIWDSKDIPLMKKVYVHNRFKEPQSGDACLGVRK